MAQRMRYLRPEFFSSPSTIKASLRARLLFMAMWGWTDEFGVGENNPYGLLGHAFPGDGLTVADLTEILGEVGKCYGIWFYEICGRAYFFIPTWTKYQTSDPRTKKRHPLPDHPDAVPDKRFLMQPEYATGIHWNTGDRAGTHRLLVIGKEGLVIGEEGLVIGEGGSGGEPLSPDPFAVESVDEPPDDPWAPPPTPDGVGPDEEGHLLQCASQGCTRSATLGDHCGQHAALAVVQAVPLSRRVTPEEAPW